MTRINAGFKVKELVDKHLLAEHRELPRIPNAIKSGRFNMNNLPDTFRLGKGHVKFFYNKLGYLKKRYDELYEEAINRGFNVSDFSSSFRGIPKKYFGNYTPTRRDAIIIKRRIKERLRTMRSTKLTRIRK